jgi:hypothetical protein
MAPRSRQCSHYVLVSRWRQPVWFRVERRASEPRGFARPARSLSSTGITASLPVTMALVEAIAGRAKAEQLARDLGVAAAS